MNDDVDVFCAALGSAMVKPGGAEPIEVLPSMEVRASARRTSDGAVVNTWWPPMSTLMYGPFLRLAAGTYRLRFDGDFPASWERTFPILAIEIIAQNRVILAHREFTDAELQRGKGSVVFDVLEDIAIEGGADAPIEFRFKNLFPARFTIKSLKVERIADASVAASPMIWHMAGRLRPIATGQPNANWRNWLSPLTTLRSLDSVFLPAGVHRVTVRARVMANDHRSSLRVAVQTRAGDIIAAESFSAADLAGGEAAFKFEMPLDLSLDSGMPRELDIGVASKGSIDIDAVDITAFAAGEATVASPALIGKAKRNVLVIGNCQASIVSQGFRALDGFADSFSVKHHFMEIPRNLHDQGRKDLEQADVLIVQDIGEWERYPLRADVPQDRETVRFPCVRFASLWPFDAFNGPDDPLARDKDYPNFEFTYFDGLLARLRKEIPDSASRFAAYRDLNVKGVVNPVRLHKFEEKRLAAMDSKYPTGVGAYILDNFRRRRVFYTTAHPNGAALGLLLDYLGKQLGLKATALPPSRLDSLRDLQVPVHPKVAEALNVKWAGPGARFRVRGRDITWEEYFRGYIDYYG